MRRQLPPRARKSFTVATHLVRRDFAVIEKLRRNHRITRSELIRQIIQAALSL